MKTVFVILVAIRILLFGRSQDELGSLSMAQIALIALK